MLAWHVVFVLPGCEGGVQERSEEVVGLAQGRRNQTGSSGAPIAPSSWNPPTRPTVAI
jgi:hypothetical protein